MRLAPALLRSICSDVPIRPSVARPIGGLSTRCLSTATLHLNARSTSSISTFQARSSCSSHRNDERRRLFSSSRVVQDEDKAMEERLLRLKRDFEAQKAAEEAKRRAAEEARRKLEEEKLRKEKEERERKERLEKEAEEKKLREEQEAEEQRQREAAMLARRGRLPQSIVKEVPESTERQATNRSAPPAQTPKSQDTNIKAESTSSESSKSSTPIHNSLDVSKPADATIPSPIPSAEDKLPRPPRPSSISSPPLSRRSQITAQASKTFASSRHVWIKNLPSQTENLRFEMTKRFNRYMEHLLRVAATTSHRLNIYTGTDYSGIQALRVAIEGQEQVVRAALKVVDSAKDDYSASFAAQAASQKEVVQLLERKHSWSAVDLERYMALIRSEHTNEQDVQKAKEQLAEKEKSLEEARAQLEKNERRLYHEEQIWSDTIRRNSTWVTFGLMGLNIFLLLSSLLIFEPWRRRRLVREIRSALDEKSVPLQAAPVVDQALETQAAVTPKQVDSAMEAIVEAATEPAEETLEQIKQDIPDAMNVETITVDTSGPEVILLDAQPAIIAGLSDKLEAVTEDTATPPEEIPVPLPATSSSRPYYSPHTSLPSWAPTWSGTWTLYKAYWADLFSDRTITLTKADLTTKALEGAAAGAAFMGLMFVLLYPRGGS